MVVLGNSVNKINFYKIIQQLLIYTVINTFQTPIWANLDTFSLSFLPDGRTPGKPHGVGGHPLSAEVQRDVLGLHLDRHPLTEASQRVVPGPGRHCHGVLKLLLQWSGGGGLAAHIVVLTPSGNIEYSGMMRRQRLSLHWQQASTHHPT